MTSITAIVLQKMNLLIIVTTNIHVILADKINNNANVYLNYY